MYIYGNLKCNTTLLSFKDYLKEFKINEDNKNDVCLFVPHTHLGLVEKAGVALGAQNVSKTSFGAYTGEVCAEMIQNFGCKNVLVGHSERRQLFCETDFDVNLKIKQCLKNEIKVVLCVGETLNQHNEGKGLDVVKNQIENALQDIVFVQNDIIIAYEPVFAIGSGIAMGIDDIEDVVCKIKKFVLEKFGVEINVIYGGSVNLKNYKEILSIQNLNGVLIGGACLDPVGFAEICSFEK